MLGKDPLVAERQISFPCIVESRPGLKQISRRARNFQPAMREWIEAAGPAPPVDSIGQVSAFGDSANVDVTVVDMPTLMLTVVITATYQFRHGQF